MNVSAYISSLVQYGLDCGLIEPCDGNFIINQLMQACALYPEQAAGLLL